PGWVVGVCLPSASASPQSTCHASWPVPSIAPGSSSVGGAGIRGDSAATAWGTYRPPPEYPGLWHRCNPPPPAVCVYGIQRSVGAFQAVVHRGLPDGPPHHAPDGLGRSPQLRGKGARRATTQEHQRHLYMPTAAWELHSWSVAPGLLVIHRHGRIYQHDSYLY